MSPRNVANKFRFLEGNKANTTNYEGFPAWKQPLEDQYFQLLTMEMFGNTFYAKEEDRLKIGLGVVKKFTDENPQVAAEIAMKARNQYYMRTFPILASAYLSTKDEIELASFLSNIIRTPRDAIQFIDLCRSGVIPDRNGLGRKVKRALNVIFTRWIHNKGEFYATKYKNQLQLIAKLTHPKVDNPVLDYIFEKGSFHTKEYPMLAAFEAIKQGLHTPEDIAKIIEKHRLDWNTLKGMFKPTPAIWKAFVKNMSAIALIKNIASTERHLGSDETLKLLRERLTVKALQKGKVLPLRIMQAYCMVQDMDIKRFLGTLANDYAREYKMDNLGRVVICPDISGSMTNMANDRFSFGEMAGMFSGVLARACPDSIMMPWSTQVFDRQFPMDDLRWRDTVYMYDYCKNANGGGTAMCAPVDELIKRKIKIDTFVLLTDAEEWVRHNWIDSWKRYLREINPKAKAILIRSDSYIYSQPYDPIVATSHNIYQMYGYSDQVFKLMTLI